MNPTAYQGINSLGGRTRRVIDLRSGAKRAAPVDDWEWDGYQNGNTVEAYGGQCKFGEVLVPTTAPDPATPFAADFTGVTVATDRYLFVESDISAGTVTLKQQAARPIDDPASSTYRKALSIWTMTASGPVLKRLLFRGAIQETKVW